MAKLNLSDIAKKHLKILAYLLVSGVLGWVLATYVMARPELVVIFSPSINYVLYFIEKELKQEGYIDVLRQKTS